MGFDFGKNDLSKLCEQGVDIAILSPGTNVETGVKIRVRGPYSTVVRDTSRELVKRRQDYEFAERAKNREPKPVSQEENEKFLVALASAKIISWEGVEKDGKEVPCTPENIKWLMTDHEWVREQILRDSDNVESFFVKK